MNNYKGNSRWKTTLAVFAAVIILASLIYTNFLASKIEAEERKKIELYAESFKKLNAAQEDEDLTFYIDILNSEETIPFIRVDEKENIVDYKNISEEKAAKKGYLERQLQKMIVAYPPIPMNQGNGTVHYLYYRGSKLLYLLRWFPYVQLIVIAVFLAAAYYSFSEARKAEQNLVWVGMSKETAHQLGTPLSSLLGWVEYLKLSKDEEVQGYVPEMEKDVKRLELITDRFSKIGSKPKLEQHNIVEIVNETVDYMKRRSPRRVKFTTWFPDEEIMMDLYPPLFNWVLENLIKNSLDAMEAQGEIDVSINLIDSKLMIDIQDTGKGISGRNKNIVFRPGYSTKKRGWGLGLSLSKRIVEEYHHGKLFVLKSEKHVGTTIRIELVP